MRTLKNERLFRQIINSDSYRQYFSEKTDSHSHAVRFSPGENVIFQGERSEYLYYLYQGKCQVSATMENGRTAIINTLTAPGLIGEIELIKNDSPFSVDALTECTCITISIAHCRDIILNDVNFLYHLCSSLVDKERRTAIELAHHISFPLEYRLARFILDNSNGDVFRIKKTVISESLGVSYRHLEKIMKKMVDEGTLQKEKLTYYIVRRDVLDKLVSSLNVFS
ncbi:MAG: transcriptional regulator YeiL [Erysipelotrichaceae bacterium]|nr:transcriptional regulator YeiL [Erysipelotrichaceae bacterium]